MGAYGSLRVFGKVWNNGFYSQSLMVFEGHVYIIGGKFVCNFPRVNDSVSLPTTLEAGNLQLFKPVPIVEIAAGADSFGKISLHVFNVPNVF